MKIKFLLLSLLAIGTVLTPPRLSAQSFTSYPEGDDVTSSLGQFQLILEPEWRRVFDLLIPNSPLANVMVTDLEKDMPKVFDRIGRSEVSVHANEILGWLRLQPEHTARYSDLYRKFFPYFPNGREFGEIFGGLLTSNQITQLGIGADAMVTLVEKK